MHSQHSQASIDHWIHLTLDIKSSLARGRTSGSGTSMHGVGNDTPTCTARSPTITTNATGSRSCGAYRPNILLVTRTSSLIGYPAQSFTSSSSRCQRLPPPPPLAHSNPEATMGQQTYSTTRLAARQQANIASSLSNNNLAPPPPTLIPENALKQDI